MTNRRGFLAFLIAAPVTSALPWKTISNALESIAPSISGEINLTLQEIIRNTIWARTPQLIAQVEANNAFLLRLKNLK